MSDPQFRLTGASGEQAPIITATGDVDLANVNQFHDMMTKAANGASALTIDLSEVSYCDSAAVRALFSVAATTAVPTTSGSPFSWPSSSIEVHCL